MRFLSAIGVLAICVALAGIIYFFAGFYDVSAANGGNAATSWAARTVREASLGKHARAPAPPAWFSTPKAVQEGAHEFAEEGCVSCHGAPGVKPDKFARGMEPDPPDLGKAVAHDPPGKVYWVIKNGIRMTGMPAFGKHMEDNEVWRAVAFAQHESGVSPTQYKKWSAAGETTGKGEAGESEKSTGSATK